jgi:hypothetical protein
MEKTSLQSGVLGKQKGELVRVVRLTEELEIEGRRVTHQANRWEAYIAGDFREIIDYEWLGMEQRPVDLITNYYIGDGSNEMIINSVFVNGRASDEGAKNIKNTRIPDAIIAIADRYGKTVRVSDNLWGKPLILQSLDVARNRLEQEKQKELARTVLKPRK